MKNNIFRIITFISALFFADYSFAKKYNLFNPVPKNEMRQIAVDRPSKSDAVQTLDAGHFMIETSFFDYVKDDETKREDFGALTALTFKFGLTQSQELQILIDSYKYSRQRQNQILDESDGFGDVIVRLKQNIFGNDGEKFGLTLIPYLKLPTNQNNLGNDNYEGGLTVPFIANFDDFSLTLQSGLSLVKDQEDHEIAYDNIINLSYNFSDKISGYGELFFYRSELRNAKWQNTLNFGLSYAINENFILDIATNFAISKYADDFNLLSGMAYRF